MNVGRGASSNTNEIDRPIAALGPDRLERRRSARDSAACGSPKRVSRLPGTVGAMETDVEYQVAGYRSLTRSAEMRG